MITGIIAEYNIFHNGHKYMIDEVKRQSDSVVAVMSGSFMQRGDIAITDKWSRAKAAIIGGADLVLELPTCYSLNAAPNFAAGGINTLNALGIIDTVAFGSESGDTNELYAAAELLESETDETSGKIKKHIANGLSYPSALSKAYGDSVKAELLSQPNNILAIEYMRVLIKSKSSINPIAIKRKAVNHHDSHISSNMASASKIRQMLTENEDISALIPYKLSDINFTAPYLLEYINNAIIAKIRLSNPEYLRNISEVSEGLENKLISSAANADNFCNLTELIKSKRYTMSKIRRIVLAALIDFQKEIFKPMPEYVRILAMNKTGMEIVKRAKKHCCVPIITKAADFKENSSMFKLDIRATDVSALCAPSAHLRKGGKDFTTSPAIL